jgi:hypothetical protein
MDTSALDQLNDQVPPAWASIWTGIQPVQWSKVVLAGATTVFCASVDADGNNRVYQAFRPVSRDNGCDFPWRFVTRAYDFKTKGRKRFRFLEYALSELAGQTDIKFSWAAPQRGRWKPFATVSFQAHEGNVDAKRIYSATDLLYALKKQSRIGRTEDIQNMADDSLASAGIEGPIFSTEPDREIEDYSFQICIEGTGPCAIRALRAFAEAVQEPETGQVFEPETDDHFVRFDGAASETLSDLDATDVTWSSAQSSQVIYKNYVGNATASITSRISQADAEKRALQIAQARADQVVKKTAPVFLVGGQ